jgi:hypothetical protein
VKDAALLVEVLIALGRAELVEQMMVDSRKKYKGWDILGLAEGNRIYVNPDHCQEPDHVVTVLVHEALHHCRPNWTELGVRRAEGRLFRAMSAEQKDAVYKVYQDIVKKFRGVRVV